MKVVTAETMRELDRRATAEGRIPGVVLMENAGRAVFEEIAARFPVRGAACSVLCGTGNNGGDGFVVARYLTLAGADTGVYLAGDASSLRGDARAHFEVLGAMGIAPESGEPRPGIKVDALLGTGAAGAPRGNYARLIRWMNDTPGPTVAVDVPSGVDSDSGKTSGEAVRARLTVTFAYPKPGLFLPPGADCAGELVVRDIGFPWDTLDSPELFRWLRPGDLAGLLPKRRAEAHKGDFGHVLIVGGSRGMSGAPSLAAKAALRAGAGLVTVAAPESAQKLVAAKLFEAMTAPLPEVDGALAEEAFEPIAQAALRCDALCLGPGATRHSGASALIRRVAKEIDRPMVIDADGLNALADAQETLRGTGDRAAVLTPHPGECARLLGMSAADVQADRMEAVRETARRYRAVCVLKGRRTLIADGRRDPIPVSINTTGNPGMATGGTGDALTGIIGALLARGMDAYDAACLGVYLHGRAGDFAASQFGEESLIAGDIADLLPRAIRDMEER